MWFTHVCHASYIPHCVLTLSFVVSIFWTASSILNSVAHCRFNNQNTLTTMTAGAQGPRGRLINHIRSIAKVTPSQGCLKNHGTKTITLKYKFIIEQIWWLSLETSQTIRQTTENFLDWFFHRLVKATVGLSASNIFQQTKSR